MLYGVLGNLLGNVLGNVLCTYSVMLLVFPLVYLARGAALSVTLRLNLWTGQSVQRV